MKDFFQNKIRAALALVVLVLVFSIVNFIKIYAPLKETVITVMNQHSEVNASSIDSVIRAMDETMNEIIFGGDSRFIEAFGYVQLLMNKKEQSNFETIKDTEGFLYPSPFSDQPRDMGDLAERVYSFQNALENKNTEFLYLLTPDKYIVGQTEFDSGLSLYSHNENSDAFLYLLNDKGVSNIDLRENFVEAGLFYSDTFFRTSPFWTIQGAFWGFTELVNELQQKYNKDLDAGSFFTNLNSYNIMTYPKSYIGSLGKKTGKYYSGVDDFSVVFPKFATDFHLSAGFDSLEEHHFSGSFEEVLISAEYLHGSGNPYDPETDLYFSYWLGTQGMVHISNKKNPDGIRLAIGADSMAAPLISFLATVSSDIYVVNLQYCNKDLLEFVNGLKDLDFVIISSSPQNITEQFLSCL